MHKIITDGFSLVCTLVMFSVSQGLYAESQWNKPDPVAFPASALLELQFDKTKALRFQWQAVAGATLYHLQEKAEYADHFVDLAANLPARLHHYRISPPLYGRGTHQYRLLSCNAAGCSASNSLTLVHNSAVNLMEWMPPQRSDLFGAALSLNQDGTVLAVGAPRAQLRNARSNAGSGAVYLYRHDQGHWDPPVVLKSSISVNRFGYPVQLDADGQVLTVGSQTLPTGKETQGAMHVYTRQGSNKWRQATRSPHYVNAVTDYPALPNSLSRDGKVLAVSEQYEFINHASDAFEADSGYSSGELRFVRVFEHDKAGWQAPQLVWPSRYSPEALFGHAISLSGDGQLLAIGAPVLLDSDDQYPRNRGAVHLYQRSAKGSWRLQTTLRSTNPHNANFFGHSVSLNSNGTVLAIGAFDDNGKSADNSLGTGLVQVYTRTASTDWQLNALFRAPADNRRPLTQARAKHNEFSKQEDS